MRRRVPPSDEARPSRRWPCVGVQCQCLRTLSPYGARPPPAMSSVGTVRLWGRPVPLSRRP
eukprot:1346398-Prymnesium_polylepis.1